MSLQLLAKQMESKGRDGDSVLVHMTHGEVAGLQKLAESAGGSLSVNPETGLVEANILRQLLPTLIGAGLMASGVGMPLAIAGGALAGGLQAKQSGQDPLTGMITGGFGAYGGAGLAGGLGLGAAGTAGTGMGAGAAGTVSGSVAPSTVAGTIPGAVSIGPGSSSAMIAAQNAGQMGSQVATYGSAANPAVAEVAATNAAKGLTEKEGFKYGMAALSPALNAQAEQQKSPYPLMSMDIDRSVAPFQDIAAYEPAMPRFTAQKGNMYIPLSTVRAAEGGLMGLAKGGMKSGGFVVPADVVAMIGEGNTDAGFKRIKAMVPSATAIKGGDGGQSDTVKTSIEGKQPARVAHGEMYIPPETVKSLGGAKKLYAMMDKVRQQATGSKKQIKPVSLNRALA
jgi:hypothetical protein